MKKTLFINLFGAPGSGKSTGATYIFSKLKMSGVDAEYVGEFAKDKCWEKNAFMFECPENQFYIGAKQFYRINQVDGKVDVAITDSPLFLNTIYNKSKYLGKEYDFVTYRLFNKFNNLNFLIKRVKPYNPNGRNQTEDEAKEIQSELILNLFNFEIPFTEISGDKEGYDMAVDIILKKMGTFNGNFN